jgi:hypothetical protein
MEIAMSNNNERADRAESALWTYLEHAQPFRKNYASAEWQAGIAGLIGDLLHLASRAELDPISIMRTSDQVLTALSRATVSPR